MPVTPSVTLFDTMQDLSGNPVAGTITVTLYGFGDNIPNIAGSYLIDQITNTYQTLRRDAAVGMAALTALVVVRLCQRSLLSPA